VRGETEAADAATRSAVARVADDVGKRAVWHVCGTSTPRLLAARSRRNSDLLRGTPVLAKEPPNGEDPDKGEEGAAGLMVPA
jgi:hypothetical protein